MLDVRDLYVRAGSSELVRGASLHLEASQIYTLLGETGSGKSLLAQAIMGNLPGGVSASGSLEVFGEKIAAADTAKRRLLWGHSLALLPQEPWLALDPTMRALPQVAESYKLVNQATRGAAGAPDRARADMAALGLAGAERKLPGELSGGMAQRTAFAAVRAGGARLLIVDEPTKGLDAALRDSIVAMLKQVAAEGGAVLAITHDVAAARLLGGTIAVMLDGEIVEQGPAEEVLARPRCCYTRRLLAADPASWPPRANLTVGESVLTAKGLSKAFGSHTLFAGLDLELAAGERVAITGPSGSGKTTLGGVLLGLIPPDAGSVSRRQGAPRWKYQKLYQDPIAAFAPHATLKTSLRDLAQLHALPWPEIGSWLERLRLPAALLERRPSQVSSGELQRFALIRTLVLKPVLLVADEPTSRLDPITQQETMDVLTDALAETACALALVTHDPAIACNVASRVVELGG